MMKLRLVQSPETEAQIFTNKKADAIALQGKLLMETLCFNRPKEYIQILTLLTRFNNTNNVDHYYNELCSFKYLNDLGTPTPERMSQVRKNFSLYKEMVVLSTKSKTDGAIWGLEFCKLMLDALFKNRQAEFLEAYYKIQELNDYNLNHAQLKLDFASLKLRLSKW